MTDRELMQEALDALDRVMSHGSAVQEAKNILRERLAQLEQEPRQWQGLTDEEIKALASWWPSYDQMPALMVLAKDIQNSLKEKNT